MEQFFKELVGDMDPLSTPVGTLIKAGSDAASKAGPEWSTNMEIVDMLNSSREACADALKAITVRLKDGDPKAVYLTLIILETCMKNCGSALAAQISPQFMQGIVALARGAKGKKNADESARLLQQWGRAFDRAKLPIFSDTYVALKAKGVTFPAEDESTRGGSFPFHEDYEDLPSISSSYKPPAQVPSPGSDDAAEQHLHHYLQAVPPASSCAVTNVHEFQRLEADLSTVFDKVALCQDVLRESPGIHADELLAEVVGFLEACRDRLADVIEAGTQGLMTEELLGRCLKVNDAVIRTLEAEKAGTGGHLSSTGQGAVEVEAGVKAGAVTGEGDGGALPPAPPVEEVEEEKKDHDA